MPLQSKKSVSTKPESRTTADLDWQFSAFDQEMMMLAISLAKDGQFSTTPNPNVGCVLVDDNRHIVGKGFHKKAGQNHAEVNALEQAGDLSQGATAYVSLEPCAHTGQTGPCALALIKAGVTRVIIGCTDPNPKVAGKGIALLEQAGLEVHLGLLQEQAESLNRCFFFRLAHKRPFVTVKLASSLDGKTALANGESKWITSAQARADVQIERAKACAILTGTDTVMHDNPRLNVRIDELPNEIATKFSWRHKQPLRVVVDSKNRLNQQYQMLTDGQPTSVYNHTANVNIQQLTCEQVTLTSGSENAQVDLLQMLEHLAEREINHIWVEAGATLTGALFNLNLVDQLVLYQAPKLLGKEGRGLTDYQSPKALKDAIAGNVMSVQRIGPDNKITIDFKTSTTAAN